MQLEPLTPNKMLHGANVRLPEENLDELEDKPTFKAARYIKHCEDAMWNRWGSEYVTALRMRHRQSTGEEPSIAVGDRSSYQRRRKELGNLENGSGSTID